jgi:hypothetical protein
MNSITDNIMKHVKDGQLKDNLIFIIGIKNPNDIKDKRINRNYFTVQIVSPDLNKYKYETYYIDCS